MTPNLLSEFEQLLNHMERALVDNNVEKVADITNQEQLCILKIAKKAKVDNQFRQELRCRWPNWVRQIEMNHKLLQQAMTINSAIISALYEGDQASY